MNEAALKQRALFYHMTREHGVVSSDVGEDIEELHSALHDLMHSVDHRMPERAPSVEEALELRRTILEVDEDTRQAAISRRLSESFKDREKS